MTSRRNVLLGIAAIAVSPGLADASETWLLGRWAFYFAFPTAFEELVFHFNSGRGAKLGNKIAAKARLTYRIADQNLSICGELRQNSPYSAIPAPATIIVRASFDATTEVFNGRALFITDNFDPNPPLYREMVSVQVQGNRY